jgi:hypothetical protein
MSGKKDLSTTWEVIAMAISTVGIYCGALRLILRSSSPIGGLPIIGFGSTTAFCIALLKNIHIKIGLTLILLTFSVAVISVVYMVPRSLVF